MAHTDSPLLLTASTQLPGSVGGYFASGPALGDVHIFGGTASVAPSVQQAVGAALPQ